MKVWPKIGKRLAATHSDCKQVYVWDLKTQKAAKEVHRVTANLPDLILEGHTDIAAYALDWSPIAPIIASGGRDKKIYLWNVEDHFSSKIDFSAPEGELDPGLEEFKDKSSEEKKEENSSFSEMKENESYASEEVLSESNQSEEISSAPVRKRDKKKAGQVSRHIREIGEYLITPDEGKIKRTLKPFARLSGHTDSVEGLVFKPDSASELCSVGVDR